MKPSWLLCSAIDQHGLSDEIVFLFFIGVMFAAVFLPTKNISLRATIEHRGTRVSLVFYFNTHDEVEQIHAESKFREDDVAWPVSNPQMAEFIRRYKQDELGETLQSAEWIGEYRLLERLREKADILREIQFVN